MIDLNNIANTGKTVLKKVINIALWSLSVILLFFALIFIPSASSVMFLVAAVLLAPIGKLQALLKKVLPKKRIKGIICTVLVLVALASVPTVESPTDGTEDTSVSTTDEGTGNETNTTGNTNVSAPPATTQTTPSSGSATTQDETTTNDTASTDKSETEGSSATEQLTPDDTTEGSESTQPDSSASASDDTVVAGSTETPPPTDSAQLPENSSFEIHFIDVGQADAALVECDGHYMLIDGGNKADSNVIYSVLKNANVPKLDIVVGTHAHEDHIGGLPGAYNYTTADLTLCPVRSYDSDAFEDFAKYAEQKGGGITIPSVGDTYSLGSATVKILGINSGSDTNDTSIVLRIDYGETSFLFTGDAERDAEQFLLNTGADLSATVLKVGHHGSDTSTTYPFLREVMPQYAVISVGNGNSYGHPTEDTLSRLRDADVTVFRTDLQGDIYCTSDGKEVSFTVQRNEDADTLAPQKPDTIPPSENPVETPKEDDKEQTDAPTQDGGRDYVVNTNSKKYHYPSCSSAKEIKPHNRWDYHGTAAELDDMGYEACKRCKPR